MEKESTCLLIWRKRQIGCLFRERVKLSKKMPEFLEKELHLWIDRQFDSFSKWTENLALSLNLNPIWLFLWIYSQFCSFSECTIKCLLPFFQEYVWTVFSSETCLCPCPALVVLPTYYISDNLVKMSARPSKVCDGARRTNMRN